MQQISEKIESNYLYYQTYIFGISCFLHKSRFYFHGCAISMFLYFYNIYLLKQQLKF